MILDLKRIFVNENSSLPITYALDLSAVEVAGGFPLKKPAQFTGVFSNKASLVELNADITYVYDAPCDRCGTPAAKEHSVHLQKSVAPAIEGEESDSILLAPDMKLDLDELIYSEVIVSLPTKHLCRETCKGICAKCGKNLNEGKCGCPEREVDPRLSALAELLKN